MKCYLVGGAVRDRLLDLPVVERDWVVVGATEEAMLEAGFERADRDFPVFLHPDTGEEYALARTERKSGPGYRGFEIYSGPDVTLEQDLLRRDLTINALAMDEAENLIDVCNGEQDLEEGFLRHVTPAFVEDPVRVLRVARFAAKLGRWGFRVAHGTHGLMKKMAASDELSNLKPERVYGEMWRALGEAQPWRFFEVLQRCGALARLLPEVAAHMGEQTSHQSARRVQAMAALKRAAAHSNEPVIRFAAALYPSIAVASDPAACLNRMRVGKRALECLQDLLELAPLIDDPEPARLLMFIKRLKPTDRPQRYADCVQAAQALWPDRMPALKRCLELTKQAMQEVEVSKLQRRGLEGAELGAALHAGQLQKIQARLAKESC